MAAFIKANHGYNLGDRHLSSWFRYSELNLYDFFNFLGSKGWEELAVVEKTEIYNSRTCWFCEYRVKWVFTVKGLKILLLVSLMSCVPPPPSPKVEVIVRGAVV